MTIANTMIDLERVFAMSRAWDRAADALAKFDLARFDQEMAEFRSLSTREAADKLNKRAAQL